jgi:hypothetical protein
MKNIQYLRDQEPSEHGPGDGERAPHAATALGATGQASPVELLQGYNTVTGATLRPALEAVTKSSPTTGGDVAVRIAVCEDLETLCNTLELNESMSASFGDIGAVSEKAKFVSSLATTTFSVTIAVYAKCITGTASAVNYRLTDEAQSDLEKKGLAKFFQDHGDAFVSSVTQGSEYYAVYVFHAQTRAEQRQLMVDMKAHGVSSEASARASLESNVNKLRKSTSTRSDFHQRLRGVVGQELPLAENLISFAEAFPKLDANSPVVTHFTTSGYESVLGLKKEDYETLQRNRSSFLDDREGWTKKLGRVNGLIHQIESLKAIYDFYGFHGDKQVDKVLQEATADRTKLQNRMRLYASDPLRSFDDLDVVSLRHGTPEVNYSTRSSSAAGGAGGREFNDTDQTPFYVEQRTRVASLNMWYGERVNILYVRYANDNKRWVVGRGSQPDSASREIELKERDFVTSAVVHTQGWKGQGVDGVTITISDGRRLDGGRPTSPSTTIAPDAGEFVMGFCGRSGEELDAVGLVFGKLKPATWHGGSKKADEQEGAG